jgi:hypothetical protein
MKRVQGSSRWGFPNYSILIRPSGEAGPSDLQEPSPNLCSQSLLDVSNDLTQVLKSSLGHCDLLRESTKGEKTHLPTDSYEEWLTSQIVKGGKPSKKKST